MQDSILTPTNIEIQSYYERDRKRKTLNAFYFFNEIPPADIHWVLARYDHFYACNANSRNLDRSCRLSATTVLRGHSGPVTSDYSGATYELAYVSVAENATGNPELLAVRDLLLRIQETCPSPPNRLIGIIVDTELGKLRDINARQIPIYDQYFLPAGFELLYASDASGSTEYLPNRMIRECDSNSTRLLKDYLAKHVSA